MSARVVLPDLMPDVSRGLRYDDVDRQRDPASLLRYLRELHALPAVRAYKARSLERLCLAPGLTVLDVGCGTGEDARTLAAAVGPRGRVLAVDLSRTMLQAARDAMHADGHRVDVVCAGVLDLPFPGGVCDRCRADRVLQHVADAAGAVVEMTRVLRPGGVLVVCDTDWDTLVVDHPATDTTHAVLRGRASSVPSGRVGRELVRLFADAALAHIDVEAWTLTFRHLDVADAVVGLRQAALDLAEAEAVPLDDLAEWLLRLETLDRQGRFFCAVTGYAAWGTKSA